MDTIMVDEPINLLPADTKYVEVYCHCATRFFIPFSRGVNSRTCPGCGLQFTVSTPVEYRAGSERDT